MICIYNFNRSPSQEDSVVDPKLFFSDADSDPTFQEDSDRDSDTDPISDPT